MFKFKPTNKTYSDPISAIFKPGIPFGRQYTKGDICLLHDRIPGSKIFLNSLILRDAILNSKEFLEEALDIKIIDNRIEEPKKKDIPVEPKPEVKEEEVKEEVVEAPTEVDPAVQALTDELSGKTRRKKSTKK